MTSKFPFLSPIAVSHICPTGCHRNSAIAMVFYCVCMWCEFVIVCDVHVLGVDLEAIQVISSEAHSCCWLLA